jgi:hypothetical protein
METLNKFKKSLRSDRPGTGLFVQLRSLWYDAKGNWTQAHAQVDQLNDQDSALVHAYLHRKEGDIWNADSWYRKAKTVRPDVSLEEEWEILVTQLL